MAIWPPLRFESDGMLIRAYRPGDGPPLSEAVNASFEHLRPWMPWAKPDQSILESESLCDRFGASYLEKSDFTLGIWEGNLLLGGTGYHLRCGPLDWRIAEVGMWIRGDRAGQGLGLRALQAMLEWGFGEWGWQRLVWRCDTRNLASVRVAEKAGMVLEATHRGDAIDHFGDRRDTHVFAMLRDEFRARSG